MRSEASVGSAACADRWRTLAQGRRSQTVGHVAGCTTVPAHAVRISRTTCRIDGAAQLRFATGRALAKGERRGSERYRFAAGVCEVAGHELEQGRSRLAEATGSEIPRSRCHNGKPGAARVPRDGLGAGAFCLTCWRDGLADVRKRFGFLLAVGWVTWIQRIFPYCELRPHPV